MCVQGWEAKKKGGGGAEARVRAAAIDQQTYRHSVVRDDGSWSLEVTADVRET